MEHKPSRVHNERRGTTQPDRPSSKHVNYARSALLDHQVDQLAGHADGLDDRLALEPLGNGFLGGSLHLLVGGIAGDVDAAADLTEQPERRSAPCPRWTQPGQTRARRRCRRCPRSRWASCHSSSAQNGQMGGKDAHDILGHTVAQRLVTVSALSGVEVALAALTSSMTAEIAVLNWPRSKSSVHLAMVR